ncbi:beta-hexosaminidase b [Culex quinquefasciatus]|uniref:Beta-hexosaminidase n=1 Tax=Culex quinquefasciatus TaxID=7176 RepID=B0XBN5_CULQU|nr:beta-hexosaminidase subunit beta [Culex quinquefasciatus]EDS44384.1 beta-hexosaminidase b [Culex quinquefasciatus]|eukprot:XP_001867057.1 beta-hexosaminidase b [Culex quinquefasciatus]
MKYVLLLLNTWFLYTNGAYSYIVDPGPVVKATKGEIWPKPKSQTTNAKFAMINRSAFQFQISNHTCDILEKAIERYQKLTLDVGNSARRSLFRSSRGRNDQTRKSPRSDGNFKKTLEMMQLNLKTPCESLPYLAMDESYDLVIDDTQASIEAFSVWGMLRGLESFSQMVVLSDDGSMLRVNFTRISDEPRFSHRGLLVDTSRHFVSVPTLIRILDGMAYNKLNVFHWHIVDDHSFPYQSERFPELSDRGAFHPSMVYSPDDVQRVIEEARLRGIRVMSEFDTPGHTRSWGVSHPELLTECFDQYRGKLGPMDPTKEMTYAFLEELFREIVHVFPDQYVHLGGDEVGFECWASNAEVMEYMKVNRLYSFEMLEEKFIQRIVDQIDALNRSSLVWQEVYVNGVRLPKGTVVHIWTGNRQDLLNRITRDGLPALLSSCWYLDHLSTGGDWRKFYNCDPHDFVGTQAQKKLVLGGEACMWGEVVNDQNILQRIFPRVSATAEKLWSQEAVKNADQAAARLEEHTCRMNLRNVPAQPPNGPGFCV